MGKDFIDEFIPSKDTRAYLHSIFRFKMMLPVFSVCRLDMVLKVEMLLILQCSSLERV